MGAEFKVGDRVRVVVDGWRSDSGHCAQAGDVYVVTAVDSEGVNTNLWWFANHEIEPVAAAPQTQLRIEAGHYYKTRDGRKVGPAVREEDYFAADGYHYNATGVCSYEGKGRNLPDEDFRLKHDLIAEWTDEPAVTNADIFDELEDWMADNPLPVIDTSTTGFTVPLYAPEFGGGAPKFKAGDRVHYKDAYCEGVGVIESDNDAPNGYGWFVTVEEKDCDHALFNNNTTRIFTEDKLRLVAEATSGKDELRLVVTVDFGEFHAALDDAFDRLRDLKRKARKLGIDLAAA